MACLTTIRGNDGMRQWILDDWTSLVALAVLAAEPESIAEWLDAMRRYQPDHELEEQGMTVTAVDEAVADDTWCLIDLRSRTAVASSDFDFPDPRGAYEPDQNEQADGFPIVWLDTPTDWLFTPVEPGWQQRVDERLLERQPLFDHRAIIQGGPLFEFLAERLWQLEAGELKADEEKLAKSIRKIHADWLMTPREDLGGRTPRQVLLADRERIQSDLEHRSYQWTRQGKPTHGVAKESAAYRYGGYGTVEVVMYFDLIRAVLHGGWDYLLAHPAADRVELSHEMRQVAERWLNTAYEDESTTPAQMIDGERRRIPATSEGSVFDCDCPICRAEAEGLFGSAPAFMWFDGHHLEMEGEFAFSMMTNEKDWRIDYELTDGHDDDPVPEPASAPSQATTTQSDHTDEFGSSVWQSSYVDWSQVTGPGSSTKHSLFALAFPVAELVSGLKQRPEGRQHMDRLNYAYDLLRQAADRDQAGSAARQLCDTLEKLCHAYPELTPRCADLQSHVDEVIRHFQA